MRVRGLAVIVEDSDSAVKVLRSLHQAGYRQLDLHSPYRLEEVGEFLPLRPGRISLGVFCAAALGAAGAYLLQYLTSVWSYPHQIGGTPLHAWPAFLPFTFEAGVLLAALTAFFSVFILSGLPRYHHPVFDIPGFDRISRDRFAVVIDQSDQRFDLESTRRFLTDLGTGRVHEF